MNVVTGPGQPAGPAATADEAARLRLLHALERKLLWLSAWMIHNANHIRPNRDGLKVGGHQASSASVVSIMAALYFEILRPEDRVAAKAPARDGFPPGSTHVCRQAGADMAKSMDTAGSPETEGVAV